MVYESIPCGPVNAGLEMIGNFMSDKPVWLSQPERDAWLGLHAVMTLLPAALDSDLQGLEGITLFDYHMLAMLSEAKDRQLTMTILASRTSASLSRLSHVVKKLEKRGWVAREQSAEDARVKIASLTDAGWEAVQRMAPHHVASVHGLLFDTLDDKDVNDLTRIARKITTSLDADHWILNSDNSNLEH
jgi:DNA-binding MarR family transcriptional regulator